MINKEAIIERLGLIFAIADNDEPKQAEGEDETTFPKIMRLATEALALLKEQPPAGEPISLERQNEILFEANRNIKVRLDASEASRKELLDCLKELVDIIDSGSVMDTFTTQPAKAAIKANKQGISGRERQENEQFN